MRSHSGVTGPRLVVVSVGEGGCVCGGVARVRKWEPGSGDSELGVAWKGQRRPQRPPERRANLQTPSPGNATARAAQTPSAVTVRRGLGRARRAPPPEATPGPREGGDRRELPGPAPRPCGHWSAPPQPPAPTLGGGATWPRPLRLRFPGRSSSSSGPAPGARPRPFEPRARAPRDVTAALIQRALRPTRVSRQREPVGAGRRLQLVPNRARSSESDGTVLAPSDPRPPAPRPCAAHQPAAGLGMRTPPASGDQVSGGRGTWARGFRRRAPGPARDPGTV